MAPSPKNTIKNGSSTSPVQGNAHAPAASINSNGNLNSEESSVKLESTIAEPLAPPPRPAVTAAPAGDTSDYFSGTHSTHSYETNPFDSSLFADRTPGGTKLPGFHSFTSPSPSAWNPTGLRTTPLSPAMLTGPVKEDYFSDHHHLRGGFPTPNESSLRSGLTPGGGGSMFPEPSPNTQQYLQMTNGLATPGTLDFHRTAMAAAAQRKESTQSQHNITSQPQDSNHSMDVKPTIPGQFDQHDANDAANGLFMLARTSAAQNGQNGQNGPASTNHYTMAPQMPIHAQSGLTSNSRSNENSPHMANRNANGSFSAQHGRGGSDQSGMSDNDQQQTRPNTRGKGKRTSTAVSQSNGRIKSETTGKGAANKKAKGNNGMAMSAEPQSEEEELDLNKEEYHQDGKKMTDEEKRKNFLERNRVAALKCRQRKKQWLANLQQKVEIYTSENDALNAQIVSLRDEVMSLKTLLMAHKDCPVSQQQGLQMQQLVEHSGYGGQMDPYGLGRMPQQQQQMLANQQMQGGRRFS